jgi:amino acid transporter
MTRAEVADRPGSATSADPGAKGLKVGALGLLSSIVIGVASTAPAYSLAASLGFVTASVGRIAPAVMLLAVAYYYMNRADPDCGTTFTWVTRAMGPKTGWIGGWAILMTDLVVMPSLAAIAGSYTFLLFGLHGLAGSTFWVTFVGVIWIVVMTAICYIGIELSANTQVFLLGAELIILVLFSLVALAKVAAGGVAHSINPSLQWLDPLKIPSVGAFSAGMLIAVFIYWGWDTAVTVNEEAKDLKRTPGRAAVISTLVLLGVYLLVSFAAQSFHGAAFLTNNSSDVLGALSHAVLGPALAWLLIVAVLTSSSASTQTTILPAARSALSMSVHGAAPRRLGSVHPRYLSPGFATLLFGAISIVWYVALTIVSPNDILGNSISALGFGIAFYYGITGFACVVYYRKLLLRSVKNFVYIGLLPFLGGLILLVMFVVAVFYYSNPQNSFIAGQAWFSFVHFDVHVLGLHLYVKKGLGPPLVLGVGLLLLGVPLMLYWRVRHPDPFFRRTRETAKSVDSSIPPFPPDAVELAD